jgi:DNA excision repair protein ERCC-3
MPPTRTPAPAYDPANPLFVQPDRSILLETFNPRYAEARDAIAPFAELEKSPEHIHTYRISNLSLWNAAAAGFTARQMVGVLQKYTKFPLPANIPTDVEETVSRYGRVKLERLDDARLRLRCEDKALLEELARQPKVRGYLGDKLDSASYTVDPAHRGVLKLALIQVGYPAEDLAGYVEGAALPTVLRTVTRGGLPFVIRDYQRESADVFYAGGEVTPT